MSNNILEAFQRDPERVLDRLVDDELRSQERRELLAAMDDEPGGWRRCALAFLESQAWRGPLNQVLAAAHGTAEPKGTAEPHGSAASPAGVPPQGRRTWALVMSIAASVVVAFLFGSLFPLLGLPDPQRQFVAQQDGSPQSPATQESTEQSPEGPPESDDPATAGAAVWDTVTVAWPDGQGGEDAIDVPIFEADDSDQSWALAENSSLPAALVRDLEQSGLKVTRQQRLWPVELSDGRRLVLPIEEVEIHSPDSVQ